MPSGPKKRKAARKKKERQAKHNSNNTSSISISNKPQGSDDPKSQDERDSDGDKVSFPVSQRHHNQQESSNENEDSEKRGLPSFVSDCKPVEWVTGDAEGSQRVKEYDAVKIETEPKSVLDIESKDAAVEHVESGKESCNGDGKSSSNSSSDDESDVFDKKWKEEPHNLAFDETSCNNVENVLPEEVTQVSGIENLHKESNGNSVEVTLAVPVSEVENAVIVGAEMQNSDVLGVVESGWNQNEGKLLPISNDENVGASTEVFCSYANGNEGEISTSSRTAESIYKENIKASEDHAIPLVSENAGASTNVVCSNANGDEGEISTSCRTAESIYKENIKVSEDHAIPLVSENAGASTNVVCSKANGYEGKVSTSSGTAESIYTENVKDSKTSDGTVIGNVRKTVTSSCAYTSEASNVADNAKDSATVEHTGNQPLVPPAQQVARRTSWTSCCGLFEVFTGSSR